MMAIDFLRKYEALKKSIPIPAVVVTSNENCDYVDYTHFSKNSFYSFQCHHVENVTYSSHCGGSNLSDCYFCVFCELVYESVDCFKCYSSTYLNRCTNCRDCHFCIACVHCSDCFGCVALTHKQYCIFNQQYLKEEYFKKIEELKAEGKEYALNNVGELNKQVPQPASLQRNNVNCPYGDNLNNSKNVYWGFDTYWLEDSGYIYMGGIAKSCWDMSYGGGSTKGTNLNSAVSEAKPAELCYEIVGAGGLHNCSFLEQGNNCTNCYYCAYVRNCSDCFGCVGLTNKQYCILNNQLIKEEYEKAVIEIKKELGWKI